MIGLEVDISLSHRALRKHLLYLFKHKAVEERKEV